MNETNHISRRQLFKYAGGAAALGTATWAGKVLLPESVFAQAGPGYDLYLGGTDGWMYLPPTPAIVRPGSATGSGATPLHPDSLAPSPFTTYIFGFRNITGMSTTQKSNQKNKAQHSAPIFWATQEVPLRVQVTNLGLQLRPDLFDAHTLHWHGFRNVIPFFDGEPSGSVAVPTGRDFTYVYVAHDPGTYMYHCHVEDVEHVHMGMTGLVFVRPAMGPKFMYNDASTAFDREFAMFMSEVWVDSHWADAHIQLPEWSDYQADFALLNGRVYPDTIAPNASIDPFNPVYDATGDLIPPAGHPELKYQPISSLVRCNAGDKVALRFANLGFTEQAMTLTGSGCGWSAATPRRCVDATGPTRRTRPTRSTSAPARATT